MMPVVLVPGMMCDGRLFGPQVEALTAQRPIYLAAPTNADRMGDLAATILAQAPPRFALAGLSLGGIVAMEMLRQEPDRIDRLALLDTNPYGESAAVSEAREAQLARVRAGELAAVMREELKPQYVAEPDRRQSVLALCMAMAEALGPTVFERQVRALQNRHDQQDTLAGVTVPTLILMGADDSVCPYDRHARMHELIPHARFRRVEGAGHLPTLEQPAATTAHLQDWLEQRDG